MQTTATLQVFFMALHLLGATGHCWGCNKMTSSLLSIQPCDTSDHTVRMSANTVHDNVSYCVAIQCLSLVSTQNRAAKLVFKCKACSTVKTVIGKPGLGKITCPKACDSITVEGSGNLCGRDPFFIDDRKCKFVDYQILKLQVALHTSSTVMQLPGLCCNMCKQEAIPTCLLC